jgi:hypothetical protein
MSALVLVAAVALGLVAARPRRLRVPPAVARLERIGPLPPSWRPVRRTIVATHHLTGGRSS